GFCGLVRKCMVRNAHRHALPTAWPGSPMRLRHTQENAAGEHRYDSATLRKVTALAARLQSAHHETLTAPEIEAIGTEVGLEPAFTRQALAQMTAAQPAATTAPAGKTEFWRRS